MPIDASIPLQAKNPQIESPMNQLAMMSDAMKIGEYQRSSQEQNQLRDLIRSGVDMKSPEFVRKAYEVSPALGMKVEETQAKNIKLGLEGRKLQSEVDTSEFKLTRDKTNNAILTIANFDTPQAALQDLNRRVQSGELPLEVGQQHARQIQSMPWQQYKTNTIQSLLTAHERTISENTKRGQDITDARSREGQKLQYGVDVVANTVTDNAGNVTQFNRQGKVIGTPGLVGKPSATFEKTAALQKQQGRDLGLAITELESATKDKGLIDQSTGSGIGRLVDVSAGAFGSATPGAIAIAKLKPIADMALKMVPRFEGPQSDKDTQSYKEAAGQLADPSLPTDLRKAAGKEVLRLMKARKNQFVNEAMANEGIGAGAGVDTSNPLLK